jgi:hypothetical protein
MYILFNVHNTNMTTENNLDCHLKLGLYTCAQLHVRLIQLRARFSGDGVKITVVYFANFPTCTQLFRIPANVALIFGNTYVHWSNCYRM